MKRRTVLGMAAGLLAACGEKEEARQPSQAVEDQNLGSWKSRYLDLEFDLILDRTELFHLSIANQGKEPRILRKRPRDDNFYFGLAGGTLAVQAMAKDGKELKWVNPTDYLSQSPKNEIEELKPGEVFRTSFPLERVATLAGASSEVAQKVRVRIRPYTHVLDSSVGFSERAKLELAEANGAFVGAPQWMAAAERDDLQPGPAEKASVFETGWLEVRHQPKSAEIPWR